MKRPKSVGTRHEGNKWQSPFVRLWHDPKWNAGDRVEWDTWKSNAIRVLISDRGLTIPTLTDPSNHIHVRKDVWLSINSITKWIGQVTICIIENRVWIFGCGYSFYDPQLFIFEKIINGLPGRGFVVRGACSIDK